MFEEFSALLETDHFRHAFPATCLVLTVAQVTSLQPHLPPALLPFMQENQQACPDIYAFDLSSETPEFRVVVWCDHAVVMEWQSFPVFFSGSESTWQSIHPSERGNEPKTDLPVSHLSVKSGA